MLWLIGFITVSLILVWVVVVRPVLKNMPVLSDAFKSEASIMDCLRVRLLGWKTKIVARLLGLSGLLVGLYPIAMGQDWTPITKMLPDWSLPVIMMAMAGLFEWLRRATENPPVVVTAKVDSGPPQVIALVPPVPSAPPAPEA